MHQGRTGSTPNSTGIFIEVKALPELQRHVAREATAEWLRLAKVTVRTERTSGYEKHSELCLTHMTSKALAIIIVIAPVNITVMQYRSI